MTTQSEADEREAGENVIQQLLKSTIVSFGGNAAGEIFLAVRKDEKVTEFVFAPDPDFPGGVAIFEVERREVAVQ